jgi:hypothetical protein
LTSLKKTEDGSFDWLGNLAADFLDWNPTIPPKVEDKCAAVVFDLLQTQPCDKQSKFMCEARNLE